MYLEMKSPSDSARLIKGLNFSLFKESELTVNYIKYEQFYQRSTRLFLKRLPLSITAKTIHEMVVRCGDVVSVVINRSATGKPLGYGTV